MGRTNTKRKSEIYGNYIFQTPDGEFMFRSTEKRANWYLVRNLAYIVKENPPTVRLSFNPKGKGHKDDPYYLSEKKNQCVVCGERDLEVLTKHHIVPIDYRRFLPGEVKSRNSHDIVPICRDCHDVYEQKYSLELRNELADKYNAPILPKEAQFPELKAIGLAYCLIQYGDTIPTNKKVEMRSRIKEILGINRLTQQKINDLASKDTKEERKKYPTHAEIVISRIGNLQEFVEMWRLHFVKSMQPKFMPKHWNVKRNIFRKK